ncbi:TPA: DUF2919 family protein [Salmonella enterica subsp. houtenae]|nr:DUF2919 family protein [Salmonella enterica subsp. houtenae]
MIKQDFNDPGNFDDNGLLRAPRLFWAGIIVMARAWWMTGMVVMMSPTGNTQSGILWPDIRFQFIALVAGIPGIVMLFIYPQRDRWPGFSRASYVLILAALFVMVLADIMGLILLFPEVWTAGWLFFCLDVACAVMLWPDRRLKTVFFNNGLWHPDSNNG